MKESGGEVGALPGVSTPLLRGHNGDVAATPPAAPGVKRARRDLVVLCLGFFLIFVSFSTTQNLVSSLIPGKLGSVTLALLYVCFCLSSTFISSTATELLTPKWALVAGASTYVFFIAANLNPQVWTLLPAAALCGIGAGLLWTGQGAYLSNVAANYARALDQPKKSVMGLFNGIFFANMQACMLAGNVIGIALLWTGEASGIVVDGVPVNDWEDSNSNNTDPVTGVEPTVETALLFYTFLAVSVSALFVLAALGHQPNEQEWASSDEESKEGGGRPKLTVGSPMDMRAVLGKVSKVFRLLADPRMYLLVVIILYLGLQAGFIAADMTKSVILPTQGVAGIPRVFICFCVFDGLGCFVLGKLSDKLGKMIFIVVGAVAHLVFYAYFLHKCWSTGDYESVKQIDTLTLYLGVGLMGIGDACYNTFSAAILAVFFLDNTEAAFSCRLIFNSLGAVVIFTLGPFVSLAVKMVLLASVLVLGSALVVMLHLSVASINSSGGSYASEDLTNSGFRPRVAR